MNEVNEDCCTACGIEFERGSGRYHYDDNSYCSICWNKGLVIRKSNESHEKDGDTPKL